MTAGPIRSLDELPLVLTADETAALLRSGRSAIYEAIRSRQSRRSG